MVLCRYVGNNEEKFVDYLLQFSYFVIPLQVETINHIEDMNITLLKNEKGLVKGLLRKLHLTQ